MHGDVAGDVVKDVGLGQVLEPLAVADGDGGRKLAPAQAVEEDVRRDIPADRPGAEPGERLEEPVDLVEVGDARRRELQLVHPFEEPPVGVARPGIVHPLEQPPPGRLVLVRVELVRLIDDVDLAVGPGLLDEGRPGGGQVRRTCRRFGGESHVSPHDNGKKQPWLEAELACRPQPPENAHAASRASSMTWSGTNWLSTETGDRGSPRVVFLGLTVGILTVRIGTCAADSCKEGSLSYEEEPPRPERATPFPGLRVVAGARRLQLIVTGRHVGRRRQRNGHWRHRLGRIGPRRAARPAAVAPCGDRRRRRSPTPPPTGR